jgi:hypothetical protein
MNNQLNTIFDGCILPKLRKVQSQRKNIRKEGLKYALSFAGAWVLFIGGICYISMPLSLPTTLILGAMAVFGALIIGGATLQQMTKRVELAFAKDVGEILSDHAFSGQFEYAPIDTFIPAKRLSSLGGVKLYGSSEFRYGVTGTWKGIDFRMISAIYMTRKAGSDSTNNNTVHFSGLILKLAVPKSMPSIVVCSKGGILDAFKHRPDKATMQIMPVENAEFSDVYEIWASDLSVAEKGITSDFTRAFMKLHDLYSRYDGAVSAAFDGNDFYLTVRRSETTDENAGSLLRPGAKSEETYEANLYAAFDEISIPCRVIEELVFHGQT